MGKIYKREKLSKPSFFFIGGNIFFSSSTPLVLTMVFGVQMGGYLAKKQLKNRPKKTIKALLKTYKKIIKKLLKSVAIIKTLCYTKREVKKEAKRYENQVFF